ncbi:MAG: hypothetical protein HY756_08960 [Nitrospirae bacterium]|nr:hypothetical protein [Nitrospirota bacterium]
MKKKVSLSLKFTVLTVVVLVAGQGIGTAINVFLVQQGISDTVLSFILSYGVSMVLVIFAMRAFLNREVIKPLKAVNAAIASLSEDAVTASMPYTGSQETELLTEGISRMLRQVKGSTDKLRSLTFELSITGEKMKAYIERVADDNKKHLLSTGRLFSVLKEAEELQKGISTDISDFSKFSEESIPSLLEAESAAKEATESAKGLFQSLTDIYNHILETGQSVREIAMDTENLSTSTSETTETISEITANLKEIEGKTIESAGLTYSVRGIASEMISTVSEAMGGMEEIVKSVEKNIETARHLEVKSKDIEKILSVITDVTKQTNLLSLNAAILAEQAGEYGRGFSVIADEITALSDKTASSAMEITDIIKTLRSDIASTVETTEKSRETVVNGIILVQKIGEAFRQVVEMARKSAETANRVQKATKEQVNAINQINHFMGIIQTTVDHIAGAVNMQEGGTSYTLGITEKLKDTAGLIQKDTEAQGRALNILSNNLGIADERVRHILNVSSGQANAGKELLSTVNNIKAICDDTSLNVREIADCLNILNRNIEAIKGAVKCRDITVGSFSN